MIQYTTDEVIKECLVRLNPVQKLKLADFLKTLTLSESKDQKKPMDFAGSINKEDIKLMKESIARGCERIDLNEW
jgi:hypothetical protein